MAPAFPGKTQTDGGVSGSDAGHRPFQRTDHFAVCSTCQVFDKTVIISGFLLD